MRDNQKLVEHYKVVPRDIPSDKYNQMVFVGVRRAGKTFMLYQKMQEMLAKDHDWSDMLYLNFEEERLYGFTLEDFDRILECHQEMYNKRPMLFLDEIQEIDGWERFARRMADSKYHIWLTGSNQKMLSKDIQARLGGRYMTREVYPYSFLEFLDANNIKVDKNSLFGIEDKSSILRLWEEYLIWGGMPQIASETAGSPVKRDYLSSTYRKIYLNDIASRTGIPANNFNLLRLLLKKMAESLHQPESYSNFRHVLSSVNGKIAPQTVTKYIEGSEDAWLILRLRNLTASFGEKERSCKYYFIDNGFLNLQLINERGKLLENAVALELFRRYGHDAENERVFFYRESVEVDFYVPEENLAVQASYTIHENQSTYDREVGALSKFVNFKPGCRRLIITNDESEIINDEHGQIEVIPLWKWSLEHELERSLGHTTPTRKVNLDPIVNAAIRLTNSLTPVSELTDREKGKILDFFSQFETADEKERILNQVWNTAVRNPKTNTAGKWLDDAKVALHDVVFGIDGPGWGQGLKP